MYPSSFPHGAHCRSRTFPITCRHCGEDIFFFTCDHGSRVLFDSLGPPWPRHNCAEYYIAKYGKSSLEEHIRAGMMTPSDVGVIAFEHDYTEKLVEAQRDRKGQQVRKNLEPMRQDPYKGLKAEEWGIIKNIIPNVNVYKKLKIESTVMASALLGDLASGSYTQVTVHTGALGEDDNASFTFLVSTKLIDPLGLIAGDLIYIRLIGAGIPGRAPVWVCEELEMG